MIVPIGTIFAFCMGHLLALGGTFADVRIAERLDGGNGCASPSLIMGGLTMKDQSVTTPGQVKMDQAKRLMEQGQPRESLLLALEVLLQELNNLRESLIGLQMVTRMEMEPPAAPVKEELPQPDFFWVPTAKTRVLH
jgi:hypothetical protein